MPRKTPLAYEPALITWKGQAMPIDVCLAKEGDDEEGWQEHVRYNGVSKKFERWFTSWGHGVCVEINHPLAYHDEEEWVEAKKAAQTLLDLTE